MSSIPTEAELLVLVQQRYPKLNPDVQAKVAQSALHVLAEPRWINLRATPLSAVKIAAHRVQHRKHF